MTTFLLIRHAAHALGGQTIAGRTPGVNLSNEGQSQATLLARRVAHLPVRAIYCSPLERTRQTAEPLARQLNLPVHLDEALSEIDFGRWSGKTLDELRPLPLWRQWNAFRSGSSTPGGELMIEVQQRIVQRMLRLRQDHPEDCIALVSHGDVIKAATACFLGVPLDLFRRIEIGLASVTVIAIAELGPWVLCVNSTQEITLPSK